MKIPKINFVFETPEKRRGRIFLDEDFLANFYTIADEGPGFEAWNNKIAFNRDFLAFKLKFPVAPMFNNLEEMNLWIEKFLENL